MEANPLCMANLRSSTPLASLAAALPTRSSSRDG